MHRNIVMLFNHFIHYMIEGNQNNIINKSLTNFSKEIHVTFYYILPNCLKAILKEFSIVFDNVE